MWLRPACVWPVIRDDYHRTIILELGTKADWFVVSTHMSDWCTQVRCTGQTFCIQCTESRVAPPRRSRRTVRPWRGMRWRRGDLRWRGVLRMRTARGLHRRLRRARVATCAPMPPRYLQDLKPLRHAGGRRSWTRTRRRRRLTTSRTSTGYARLGFSPNDAH